MVTYSHPGTGRESSHRCPIFIIRIDPFDQSKRRQSSTTPTLVQPPLHPRTTPHGRHGGEQSEKITSGHQPRRSFRGVRSSSCAARVHVLPSSGGFLGASLHRKRHRKHHRRCCQQVRITLQIMKARDGRQELEIARLPTSVGDNCASVTLPSPVYWGPGRR